MHKLICDFKILMNRFQRNEDGAVAMIYGPMAIVLLLAAGVSIDYARGYLVKKEIARALDAAVLAAGSLPEDDEDAMRTLAEQYFDANISASTKQDYDPQIVLTLSNNQVTVTSSANVPTILMRLAGHDNMIVNEKSVAGRTLVNVEVALVLDNTGSMSWSGKLSSLKTAAKKLVDTLYEPAGSDEHVKFALVPFSGAVNIGTSNETATWFDKDGDSVAAQEDYPDDAEYDWDSTLNGLSAFDVLDRYDESWNGCVRARVGTALNDEGDTVDLDLWDIPYDSTNVNTKWAPHVKPIHLWNGSNDPEDIDDDNILQMITFEHSCTTKEILPLTNEEDTIKSKIDNMEARGGTNIPVGLVWGWRVLSSAAPFTEGESYSNALNKKVIVLLTDGQNDLGTYSFSKWAYYSAYGMPKYNHLGTNSWLGGALDDKLEQLCTNVKSKDILIYSITFAVTNTNTQNLMRNCATRTDMYFNSPNGDALEDAFEQIATGLQKLRLSK